MLVSTLKVLVPVNKLRHLSVHCVQSLVTVADVALAAVLSLTVLVLVLPRILVG